MKSLKFHGFKHGGESETTVTIPGGVLRLASRLIPNRTQQARLGAGIDTNEWVHLAGQPGVQGTLVEIEGHAKNEWIVIVLG